MQSYSKLNYAIVISCHSEKSNLHAYNKHNNRNYQVTIYYNHTSPPQFMGLELPKNIHFQRTALTAFWLK
jgi:hypothetical protein